MYIMDRIFHRHYFLNTKALPKQILCGLVTGQALFAGVSTFIRLYGANREISKACLQIIFGYRSEAGLLAWVRENTRR